MGWRRGACAPGKPAFAKHTEWAPVAEARGRARRRDRMVVRILL